MKTHLMKWFFTIGSLIITLLPRFGLAQELPQVHISIIDDKTDSTSDELNLSTRIRDEVQAILKNRYQVTFDLYFGDFQVDMIRQKLEEAYAKPEVDLVIASGVLSSGIMAQRDTYPKPSIASVILDNELQRVPLNPDGSSGIPNFTYLQTPFNISRDLNTLKRVHSFQKVGFVGPEKLANILNFPLEELFQKAAQDAGADYELVSIQADVSNTLAQMDEDIDAIYLLPFLGQYTSNQRRNIIEGINSKKLPSTALLGEVPVQEGVLLAYEAENNIRLIPRRIATNSLKILEGQEAADLKVAIPVYTENVIINMATAKQTGYYPDFDLMAESMLINVNVSQSEDELSLQKVILRSLESNLDIKVVEKDVELADKDVDIAQSDLLPQIDANTNLNVQDQTSTDISFGAQGRWNWTVGGSLSQVIFNEPVLANIAINKHLREAETQVLKETQLDIIQQATTAYLTLLQAKTFVRIQRDNVLVTKENYDIAKAKESVGYSGVSDLNRWTSELAQSNIELNSDQANYRQSQFLLNQLLNFPVNQDFQTQDVSLNDQLLLVTDQRITDLIKNYGDLDKLASFMVEEGMRELPELKQIQAGILATERQRKSQWRRFYLPSVQLSGNTNYLIERWDTSPSSLGQGDAFSSFTEQVPTWSFNLTLSYPIFSGNQRRLNLQRTYISLAQLKDQTLSLRLQLELRIRSALEVASASFFRIELSEIAADAARKNFEIMQDSYSQGLVNITSLIDAQNASLQATLNAENAIYQFIIDFLEVERSVGSYYFLAEPAERDAFFERLNTYLLSND